MKKYFGKNKICTAFAGICLALMLSATPVFSAGTPMSAGEEAMGEVSESFIFRAISGLGRAIINIVGEALGQDWSADSGEKNKGKSPLPNDRQNEKPAGQKPDSAAGKKDRPTDRLTMADGSEIKRGKADPETEKTLNIMHRAMRFIFIRQNIEDRLPPPSRYVKLKNVPDNMRWAILAMEDRSFYDHHGFDVAAIARAVLVNMKSGEIEQGASTITQQLVKNLFLSSEQVLSRKAEELLLAIVVEARCEKDEILEYYLNTIYYGSGFYGLYDASYGYFGHPPDALTLAECAMLAGLPQAPSVNSPFVNLAAARRRQHIALDAMVAAGYIRPAVAEAAKKEPLALVH